MRKAAFDQTPAGGEIRIDVGQGPNRVQVIRQDNGSFDREGMAYTHLAKRRPNTSMWSVNSARRRSASQTDREDITASRQLT
jgi:hypothetical protein